MSSGTYDIAQVCRNGHTVTSGIAFSPEMQADYCKACAAATLTACEACQTPIRGHYHVPGVFGTGAYTPPSFCHGCGRPYPWTAARLAAAKVLVAEQEELTAAERQQLDESIEDLVRDTPMAPVAAIRFRRLMAKVAPAPREAFKILLVEVVAEAARKLIWLV